MTCRPAAAAAAALIPYISFSAIYTHTEIDFLCQAFQVQATAWGPRQVQPE